MSWFTSWIPDIPQFNFAIPGSIQGRFISFVLKKTLGHFLKPGQLDYHQIDSQIGSGYVQVSDLELDAQTINSHLNDLPIRLHTGVISSVKVRIPWPNPLSSTLGFSVKSLHLLFHLAPQTGSTEHLDISDSIASVAHSFVQEELSSHEDAVLWNSLNPEVNLSQHEANIVPGDFSETSTSGPTVPAFESDPAGVSVFAGLIERLLAKFEFDTEDICITIVHPGNISLTLSIAEMRYATQPTTVSSASTDVESQGESRSLTISGLSLSSCNLYHPYTPSPIIPETPTPASPSSSNSSIDEQTHVAMSQSLAFLPPRDYSPVSSASSSMYESALSTTHSPSFSSRPNPQEASQLKGDTETRSSRTPVPEHELILTFGSQAIVFELSTPPPTPSFSDDPFISQIDPSETKPELKATLTLGILSCLIRPWQVCALSRLFRALPLSVDGRASVQESQVTTNSAKIPPLEIRGSLRSIVVLLMPTSTNQQETLSIKDFFARPLVPPAFKLGYTRFHVDSLVADVVYHSDKQTLRVDIEDVSLFFFISNEATELRAVPVLITDWNLIEQYPRNHFQPEMTSHAQSLPSFEDLDWSSANCSIFGVRLSRWRNQTATLERPHLQRSNNKAISISIALGKPAEDENEIAERLQVVVETAPLHIRLHFGQLLQPGGPMTFFEDLYSTPIFISDGSSISSDHTVDQFHYEGRSSVAVKSPATQNVEKYPSQPIVSVHIPLVRLSLRCPPPPTSSSNRSGGVILDLDSVKIATAPPLEPVTVNFADEDTYPQGVNKLMKESTLLHAEFNRALIALSEANSSVATGLASIGDLQESVEAQESSADGDLFPPIRPKLSFIQRKDHPPLPPITALSVELPGVYLDISKSKLVTLQYWIDDLSQFLERASASDETIMPSSGNTSIIGSRFFVNSRAASTISMTTAAKSETVVKITITEGFVKISLPRSDMEQNAVRPFIAKCSDVDVLVELNPDRKHQTILTLGIMDIIVEDTTVDHAARRFLASTPSKSLSSRNSVIKLRVSSSILPVSNTKETKITTTLSSFAFSFFSDTNWISDLTELVKNPPGTFESVVPNDRTRISVKISDGSLCVFGVKNTGALAVYIQETTFSTDVVDDSDDSSFQLLANEFALLFIDHTEGHIHLDRPQSVSTWTAAGYALLAEVGDLNLNVIRQTNPSPSTRVLISRILLRLHLCADTLSALSPFFADLSHATDEDVEEDKPPQEYPAAVELTQSTERSLMSSVDDLAFKKVPAVGSAPDMIYDDLPTNTDYLDESFGTAAGLREIVDEDVDEFDQNEYGQSIGQDDPHIISRVGGETIKVFDNHGLALVEDYYLNIPPDNSQSRTESNNADISVRVQDGHVNVFLYDGYDWAKTRKTIEEEVKGMRKRLLKIRQLVATGQMQDSTIEDTSALLYNSVRIGLLQDEDALAEPSDLIAAIDEELNDDLETSSQSSWQSLRPTGNTPKPRIKAPQSSSLVKRLRRAKVPSMEFCLSGLSLEFDKYRPDDPLVSRTFATIKDLEILDHIKSSTWKKFLTELRSDSRGNIRETGSNMVRIEIRGVRPVAGNAAEEVRLKAKLLPLRLYVDQDAVDFLKKFFSFQDPNAGPASASNETGAFIQLGEIFPIDLKLDYKPRRVDYRALKEGRTIELMNFFHFDGAEMTLRHITLAGITGWGKFFEMLNDLWTPDVKATQLVEVISGVAPIRSVVNVGSGVADLILLPIAQYKKDGRVVRGVQKGATSFVKSTAIEAIKMGAKLATGTQVILEQAEGVLGGRFDIPITGDSVQVSASDDVRFDDVDEEATADLISKYAQQPGDLKEGVQSAYNSLRRNLSSAAQTILAVPMEVYERSGNEGPVRSVIRAVPIAVLKPMIGASEAVSKTLLGLHNTLDPNVRLENEAKYKM